MAVPDSVVSFLLQNLSRLLVDEINLRSGVKGKITSLSNELQFINIFLKSSEGKRNDEMVKVVVNQIRDVAHKAEDVVDTYIAKVTKQSGRNILGKLVHFKSHEMMLHDVNAEIENIKGTIDEIYRNKDIYGIGEGEFKSEAAESLHKKRRDVEEDDVVGFGHDSSVIIKKLMKRDSRRNVVSIIGMGGLGKTTLARKIYNNNQVKELFPCRAWGYVSNDYKARELLLSLLQCLLSTSDYKELFKKTEEDVEGPISESEETLKKKVKECLSGKKYLIVLDDIWKTEVWDEVKDAFPDDHHSSRILITSRIKEVASYTGTTLAYKLPFLNIEDSWKLFSKKVFGEEEFPFDLQPLAKSIVESCGGLPLAIIVLAGIVAKKEKSQREAWLRSTKDHINWHLAQDKKVMDILKLSYDSLPGRLKPFFLYFGIYPEDSEIPVRQLIQLWIAEGFIELPESGIPNAPKPEDVADDYLDELVDRSLIQVARRRSDGGVKTCRIHDLLRDLCISESKSDKFLEVCTESNVRTLNNPRRLSLHCTTEFYISSTKWNQPCTRSLFCFVKEFNQQDIMKWILKSFKLARVLDLGKLYFYSVPSDLKTLIHLRYLRIDVHSLIVNVIQSSISSLWNLETLDVRHRNPHFLDVGVGIIKTLPSGMWKLKQLRHLYMEGPVRLPTDMSGSDSKTMWNLQTLCFVALDSLTESLVNNGRFPKLTKLGLYRDRYHPKNKYRACEQLKSLHRLINLRTLKIYGTSKLPLDANAFPSNLTKITIKGFRSFHVRRMSTLGRLINLQILKIIGNIYFGQNSFDLNCAAGEFPQLQVFQIKKTNVIRWRLEGAMPRLRRLVIKKCRHLTELPEELWSLTTLRVVQVLWPSTELANSLQNVELKNGCKLIISHRPPTEAESNSVSIV